MKTSKNPCLDIALRELRLAGIRDVEVAHGSKHPQVRFRINGGSTLHVFAVSGTPSDWRSPENTRRDLKKFLRDAGVITPEPMRPLPLLRKPDRVTMLERRVSELERQLRELKNHDATEFAQSKENQQ